MDWDELEKKHMKEWGEFQKLRDEAWNKMQRDNQAMGEAFGNREDQIPQTVRERIERDNQSWHDEWSLTGTKVNELKAAQRAEIDLLKKKEAFKAKFRGKNSNDKDQDKDV